MTSRAWKCPADLIRWQKSVDVHQNPAHTSPTHLSTHSYPTLISKKHHMLTSREKCGLEEPLGLHFEVLADSVDAHFGGGGFDDQDSLAAQLHHRFAAAFEHLLGGGGAEHFFLGGGPALGEGVEFVVLEQHEDDEGLAHQLRGGGDEFGAAGAVGHLRDPDDQAAAALHVLETGDGVEVVGFGGFAAGLAEEVDQQAEVQGASTGGQSLLDVAAVGHQGKLVAGSADNLRQHDGGGGGLVELRDGEEVGAVLLGFGLVQELRAAALEVEGGAREAAGVEDDPDLLRPLDGELAGDEVAAAGGCGPGDVAELVALLIVAQTLELASHAAQAQATLLQLDLAGAHEVELGVFACLLVRGVDADVLRMRR